MRPDIEGIKTRLEADRGRVWTQQEALDCYYDRNALLAYVERLEQANQELREALEERVCRHCSLKPGTSQCLSAFCFPNVQRAFALTPEVKK
jgi:hypothetical protein